MSLLLMLNGKAWHPERALREKLPFDTPLRCPFCNGGPVRAWPARTTARLGGEAQHFIPRMQDRACEHCKNQWAAVLPPLIYCDPAFLCEQSGVSPIMPAPQLAVIRSD